jgi:hypothetical protein
MRKTIRRLALVAVLVTAACATQSEFLAQMQPQALQTVMSRAQFEMNCPSAAPTILSQEVVQPALQGPWVQGVQRAEYTIGVAGCGQRKEYVVICPQGGDGCFATGPGRFGAQ